MHVTTAVSVNTIVAPPGRVRARGSFHYALIAAPPGEQIPLTMFGLQELVFDDKCEDSGVY